MVVEVALKENGYVPPALIVAIGARGNSPHKHRVADGLRLLNQLAKAAAINLGKILISKRFRSSF